MTGARLRRATTKVETALPMIAPRPKAALEHARSRCREVQLIRGKHYVQQVEPTDENVLTAEHDEKCDCTGPLG